MALEHNSDAPLPDKARIDVIRDLVVFQVKLFADGFKDLLLSPFSILAGIAGLLLGGRNPGMLFYRLLRFGQRIEDWIGLFSAAYPRRASQPVPNPQPAPTEPDTKSINPEGSEHSERVTGDFDDLVDRLQRSLLDPATRSRLSEQSKKQLEAIAKRLRKDGA